jgi:hypothetical protein
MTWSLELASVASYTVALSKNIGAIRQAVLNQ